MRILMEGIDNGGRRHVQYDVFDEYDAVNGVSSMARTTGYACSAAANLVLAGKYREPGVSPPEYLGRQAACFDYIMEYLRQRGIQYRTR